MGYCFVKRCAGGGNAEPPCIEPLTITENGTYTASGDIHGFSPITVDIPSSPSIELQEKSVTITENTTTEVAADAGKALSKVTITTAVKQNYCLVRFYNDDRTTLLYEVLVPYGSSAVYAGDAPVSSLGADYTFTGFEPSTESVTADIDCYAVYDEPTAEIGTLEETSWANIAAVSEAGTAANYFAVGDTKAVVLAGTIGTKAFNGTYYAFILGFNHNSEYEGNGIHFGTFKTAANGIDISLHENGYGNIHTDGTKYSNINHWGTYNYGGWAGSDLRYDVLGSTDVAPSGYGAAVTAGRVGNNPTANCATNPVPNTFMAALPSDLRAVMKPMIKYTDNVGGTNLTANNVTESIDYLPLLAEYEIMGARKHANSHEQSKQKQYDYYAVGNGKKKYSYADTTVPTIWFYRSCTSSIDGFCGNDGYSGGVSMQANLSCNYAPSPIFKV